MPLCDGCKRNRPVSEFGTIADNHHRVSRMDPVCRACRRFQAKLGDVIVEARRRAGRSNRGLAPWAPPDLLSLAKRIVVAEAEGKGDRLTEFAIDLLARLVLEETPSGNPTESELEATLAAMLS